jgi:anaerobic selenocysteine-containing dehydrogenase
MRADGQFNKTIYNEDDRFRGIQGGHYLVFINPNHMAELDLKQRDLVTLSTEPPTVLSVRSASFGWCPMISHALASPDIIQSATA